MDKIISTRFKNIDFFRFVFAVLIVMFHFRKMKGIDFADVVLFDIKHFHICVDFFFIIAGFFLFKNIDKAQDTLKFFIKRFLRLAPLLWVYVLLLGISSLIFHCSFSFDGNILKLFLLNNIGFAPNTGGAGAIIHWFVAVLFWISLFYFYIHKIFEKKYFNLIMWLITILSLGIYINWSHFNSGGNTTNIYYGINIGIIRGLYSMGIGYYLSMLYSMDFLKQFNSKLSQIIFSITEILIFGIFAYYLLFSEKYPGKSAFVLVFIFAIIMYLSLIKKGILTKYFDKDYFAKLGQYSYSIYVMHPLFSTTIGVYVYNHYKNFIIHHPSTFYYAEVTLAVIFGIFIHYIFEKPINNYIKTKFTK